MAGRAVWARYQFLEELWRGQDRIVFDPGLEEALRVGGPGLGHQSHPALTALSDALIPRAVGEDNVWVALANPRRAAEYARLRGGTTFIGLDEASALGSDEDWQVALVDLEGMIAEEGDGGELEARLAALLEVLAEGAGAGKTVIVSTPAVAAGGIDYESFARLVGDQLPVAHVYGIGAAEAALVFAFGDVTGTDDEIELVDDYEEGDLMPVGYVEDREVAEYEADLDAAEQEWTDHGIEADEDGADGLDADEDEDDEGDEDDVPVDYDNSLGDEEPEIREWVAICGRRSLGRGMTVIELPAEPSAGPGPRDSALRAQLAQVQRQADLAAIERQRLAEQLDEAEERVASLVEERAQLLEGALDLEATMTPETAVGLPALGADDLDDAARLDAALAREQALRWELNRVKAELEQARTRPVDVLEAELAELRARLEQARAQGPAPTPARADDEVPESDAHEGVAETVFVFTESAPIPAQSPRLRQEVDRLLARIERGGMPTLELHRALKRLRGFFRG